MHKDRTSSIYSLFFNSDSGEKKFNITHLCLILFPLSIPLLPVMHGAVVFLCLVLYLFQKKKDLLLSKSEKTFFFSVILIVFVVYFVTIYSGVGETGWRKLFKFSYLLLILPVYLLFRCNVSYSYFWNGLVIGAYASAVVAIFLNSIDPAIMGLERNAFVYGVSGVSNAIIFGDLSLLLGLMAVSGAGWFISQASWKVVIPLMALLCGLIASALSQSRGGWVALPFVIVLYVFFARGSIEKWKLALGVVGIFAVLSLMYNSEYMRVNYQINRTLESISMYLNSDIDDKERETSLGMRFEAWQASWQIFLDNPLVGVGWGNFQEYAENLVAEGKRNRAAAYFSHPHNQFFSSMASGGLLGLGATLVLFVVPVIIFYRAIASNGRENDIRRIALAGLVMVVGFAVCNLTESFLERSRPVSFFLFYLAVCMAGIRQNENDNSKLVEES